jgi:hypothetical protein
MRGAFAISGGDRILIELNYDLYLVDEFFNYSSNFIPRLFVIYNYKIAGAHYESLTFLKLT